eukprot:9804100-Alexandrium_andersonii.AAC.1
MAARAIRIIQREADMHSWTVWNPARLACEIQEKAGKLEDHPCMGLWCPCGNFRAQGIGLARLDASTFFKHADFQRG